MSLVNQLISHANLGRMLSDGEVSQYSPTEIREAIQQLVANDNNDLAYALGDAGISLYPNSEDMLAINGLLAIMRQDWRLGVDYLEDLMTLQGEHTQPFTFVMLVRALRCNLDPARALEVVRKGLKAYPEHTDLMAESLSLEGFTDAIHSTEVAH
jgi:hypothetical protein